MCWRGKIAQLRRCSHLGINTRHTLWIAHSPRDILSLTCTVGTVYISHTRNQTWFDRASILKLTLNFKICSALIRRNQYWCEEWACVLERREHNRTNGLAMGAPWHNEMTMTSTFATITTINSHHSSANCTRCYYGWWARAGNEFWLLDYSLRRITMVTPTTWLLVASKRYIHML
jgi:hypothetical protein